jgi:predicted nuclease of predicted toxin-antitoxin system
MTKFIVDANLPYYFSIWESDKFIHVFDINDSMSDEEIWEYAKEHDLTIITKDADFSIKALFKKPPPRVIHLRIGNMKLNALYEFINKNWSEIENTSGTHTLTNVYLDRIEGIE